MSSYRFFTRDFTLLFIANFVVVAVYFLLITMMAAYAMTTYDGCTDSMAGLAASIFLIAGMVGRVVSGRYADSVGLRRLSVIAMVIMLVSCAAYLTSGVGLGLLLVIRFVHGISFGIANTTLPAIVAKMLPPERLGEGTGYFMLSNSLGIGIGPVVGLLVSNNLNYQIVFIICSVVAAIALVSVAASRVTVGRGTGIRPGRFRISSFLDPKAARFSVVMLLVGFAYGSISTHLNGFAIEQGLAAYAPFMFLVYSAALLVSRPIAGRIMDKHGENVVLYTALLFHALSMVLVAVTSNGVMLICVGIFLALGFGTVMSVAQAVVVKLLGRERSTVAVGTFFFLTDFGSGISPYFLGLIVTASGYRVMYLFCAVVALAGLVYYFFEHGHAAGKARG